MKQVDKNKKQNFNEITKYGEFKEWIQKEVKEFTDNIMCKLQVDKSVQPFFYTRGAIKEKIKSLKHLHVYN